MLFWPKSFWRDCCGPWPERNRAPGRLCPQRPQGGKAGVGQEVRQRQPAHVRQDQRCGECHGIDWRGGHQRGVNAGRKLRATSGRTTPAAQDASKPADASDAQKTNDDWKQKIAAQQGKVDLLTRELDVSQREYRLRAAAFYADAGNRLRGSATWDKEDAQYKQQIAQKQKALDDAKKAVDDLKEQARKAGVPAKMRE